MRLTSAHRLLIAAALADRHDLPISDAIDMADTAANALAVDNPSAVVAAALAN